MPDLNFACIDHHGITIQMEANAHDWVLPVMSAHIQAEKNITLSTAGAEGEEKHGKKKKDTSSSGKFVCAFPYSICSTHSPPGAFISVFLSATSRTRCYFASHLKTELSSSRSSFCKTWYR